MKTKKYKKLVERVREINPDAAEYLMNSDEMKRLKINVLSKVLEPISLFVFCETLQGQRYWWNIHTEWCEKFRKVL